MTPELSRPAGVSRAALWTGWIAGALPVLILVAAFAAFAVIPFGSILPMHVPGAGVDEPIRLVIAPGVNVAVLYVFAVSSIAVYGVILGGWASNNKYSLLGGLRSSAQMFSYELALGLSWVGVIMIAGSFQLTDIVNAQAGGFWRWNAVLQFPAFLAYIVAATAEVNRVYTHNDDSVLAFTRKAGNEEYLIVGSLNHPAARPPPPPRFPSLRLPRWNGSWPPGKRATRMPPCSGSSIRTGRVVPLSTPARR